MCPGAGGVHRHPGGEAHLRPSAQAGRGEEKRRTKQPCQPQGESRRGSSPQIPPENPGQSRWICPKGAAACAEEPVLEQISTHHEYHGGTNIHPAGSGRPCAKAAGCALKEVASCEDKPTQEQAPGWGHSMWGTHSGGVCS